MCRLKRQSDFMSFAGSGAGLSLFNYDLVDLHRALGYEGQCLGFENYRPRFNFRLGKLEM